MNWLRQFIEAVVFRIERFLIRGVFFQLLSIAALIVITAVVAGFAAFVATEQFSDLPRAYWWAFLRLSDPGYLGDDEGTGLRTISTILTVLGYVLFMGSLVAILTQSLNRFMSRLEAGLTPLREKNHVIILGLTHRTPLILRELLLSKGRVRRFLKRIRKGSLKVVVLSENVNAKVVYDLKAELGHLWSDKKVILRSGSPLELEHLERVNILNAAAVIYPGSDLKEERQYFDSSVFKVLLNCQSYARAKNKSLPLIVTELVDYQRMPLIEEMGMGAVIPLPSSTIISRLITQNIRHNFLSFVYDELLTHGIGNEVYTRPVPELKGLKIRELVLSFPKALFIGVLRGEGAGEQAVLNPALDFVLEEGDRGVFVAASYEDTTRYCLEDLPKDLGQSQRVPPNSLRQSHRILILGWSYKVPEIIDEFSSYSGEHFEVDIVCELGAEERTKKIKQLAPELDGVRIRHFEANYLSHSFNESFDFKGYDNILFIAEDNLKTDEQADARTWLAYLQLSSSVKSQKDTSANFLAELLSAENEEAFLIRNGETLVGPVLLAHMMAHITLRPELNKIFNELFGMGGAEICFYTADEYDVTGPRLFADLQKKACSRGELALGLLRGEWGPDASTHPVLFLNPSREESFGLTESDRLVVLTTYEGSGPLA